MEGSSLQAGSHDAFRCPAPEFSLMGGCILACMAIIAVALLILQAPDIQAGRYGLGLGGFSMPNEGEVAVPDRAVRVPSDMTLSATASQDCQADGLPGAGSVTIGSATLFGMRTRRTGGQLKLATVASSTWGSAMDMRKPFLSKVLLDNSDANRRRWK